MITWKEIFADKYHILDSFSASSIAITITQFLQGAIKYVGWGLTIILFLRGLYGLYKDRLDVKIKQIEIREKERKEKEEEEKLKQKENGKVKKFMEKVS
jgi:hypothetical protein